VRGFFGRHLADRKGLFFLQVTIVFPARTLAAILFAPAMLLEGSPSVIGLFRIRQQHAPGKQSLSPVNPAGYAIFPVR